MSAAAFVKWAWVGMVVLNIVITLSVIGKPRRPITPGLAAGLVLYSLAWATAVIVTWDTSQ